MFSASDEQSSEIARDRPVRHGEDVPPLSDGREAARQAVLAQMRARGYGSARQLALAAGTGYNAINEWLKGDRQWPRRETRAKIELAMGWEPGELARVAHAADQLKIARSADSEAGPSRSTAASTGLVLDFAPGALDGLSPTEAQEVHAAAVLAALERLREIRAAKRERGSDVPEGDEPWR